MLFVVLRIYSYITVRLYLATRRDRSRRQLDAIDHHELEIRPQAASDRARHKSITLVHVSYLCRIVVVLKLLKCLLDVVVAMSALR